MDSRSRLTPTQSIATTYRLVLDERARVVNSLDKYEVRSTEIVWMLMMVVLSADCKLSFVRMQPEMNCRFTSKQEYFLKYRRQILQPLEVVSQLPLITCIPLLNYLGR